MHLFRASGAEPLVELFEHTIEIFKKKQGDKLSPLDVHSIMCMIGSIVVVGGVRRSAMISLSDLSDDEIRDGILSFDMPLMQSTGGDI